MAAQGRDNPGHDEHAVSKASGPPDSPAAMAGPQLASVAAAAAKAVAAGAAGAAQATARSNLTVAQVAAGDEWVPPVPKAPSSECMLDCLCAAKVHYIACLHFDAPYCLPVLGMGLSSVLVSCSAVHACPFYRQAPPVPQCCTRCPPLPVATWTSHAWGWPPSQPTPPLKPASGCPSGVLDAALRANHILARAG